MKIIYSLDKNFIYQKIFFNNNNIFVNFNNNIDEIDNAINALNLFEEKNYIITNCSFLEKLDKKSTDFLKKNKSKNIVLILESKNIDLKNISKINNIEIIYLPELNLHTMKKYINDIIFKNKIKILDRDILYSILIPNSLLIENEIKKLSLIDGIKIDKSIFEKIIFDYSKGNIFNLIIFLLNNEYSNLFNCLDNLIFKGYSIENIINVLSAQLFNLKIYIQIYEKNKNLYSISKELNISEYKIKNFYNIIKSNNSYKIGDIMNKLLIVEINIKKNKYDPYLSVKKLFLEV